MALTIDGSFGEGGGQIVRTAVALSAITGTPIEVANVRANRAKPGLQPQHRMAVQAAAAVCGASTEGVEVGSGHFEFAPGAPPQAGTYHFDVGTAGSAYLVLQTVLVPLLLAEGPSRVVVRGGTHNPLAPSADYLEHVFLPALRRAGAAIRFGYDRAGFFPKGGGELALEIEGPARLTGVDFASRGGLLRETAVAVTSGLAESVGVRAAEALRRYAGEPCIRDLPSAGPGAAAFVGAEFESGFGGFVGLGARGKPMERVCEEAGEAYREWRTSAAGCDAHLADQLVLPMTFAGTSSRWTTPEVTEHLRTVLWVVRQFLPADLRLDGNLVQVQIER